jgi:hypothetical protein
MPADPTQHEQELLDEMKRSLWPGRTQIHPDGREDIWLVGKESEKFGSQITPSADGS